MLVRLNKLAPTIVLTGLLLTATACSDSTPAAKPPANRSATAPATTADTPSDNPAGTPGDDSTATPDSTSSEPADPSSTGDEKPVTGDTDPYCQVIRSVTSELTELLLGDRSAANDEKAIKAVQREADQAPIELKAAMATVNKYYPQVLSEQISDDDRKTYREAEQLEADWAKAHCGPLT